jgi:hypothetical protein
LNKVTRSTKVKNKFIGLDKNRIFNLGYLPYLYPIINLSKNLAKE